MIQSIVQWVLAEQWHVQFIISMIVLAIMFNTVLLTVAYLILLERKGAGWIQDRWGPNRVGPQGLLQPIADGLKMFLKEDITPGNVDKPLFILAPGIAVKFALLGMAIIPWGGPVQLWGYTINFSISTVDIGVLFILATGGLGVYAIVLAGYGSNSKYSFLGGLRSTAMMLSYEVPLGLCVLALVLVSGQVTLDGLIDYQINHGWNIFAQPLAAIIVFTCLLAEGNRMPFDLPECEQELVGGYHTEYSSMKFASFFLAEYAHLIIGMALFTALFLGGWHLPFIATILHTFDQPNPPFYIYFVQALGNMNSPESPWWIAIIRFAVYWTKVLGLVYFVIWIRWTVPRFRFDQLLRVSWKGMIPIATAILIVNMFVLYIGGMQELAVAAGKHPVIYVNSWPVLLLLNVGIAIATYKFIVIRGNRMSGALSRTVQGDANENIETAVAPVA